MAQVGTKLLAVLVTMVAALMTATAAWDRGGTMIDKGLLVALSVVIVLAVHLLPALSRRPVAWVVWGGCLVCAIYGHLTFLTHASLRASQSYAQESVQNVGTDNQIQVVRESLSHYSNRSAFEVAEDIAKTKDWKQRSALKIELASAQKADELREKLIGLSKESTKVKVDGAVDPVTQKLASVLGVTSDEISVIIGLTFALLVELIGALLWVEALRPSHVKSNEVLAVTPVVTNAKSHVTSPAVSAVTQVAKVVTPEVKSHAKSNESHGVTNGVTTENSNVTQSESHDVTIPVTTDVTPLVNPVVTNAKSNDGNNLVLMLKEAVESGKCKATVNGIREFLGCSQTKASDLRKALVG